jgi:hypothetical protein
MDDFDAYTKYKYKAYEPPTQPVRKREWVGLTNDEVNEYAAGCHLGKSVQIAIRAAEAKLKEKNGGQSHDLS